MPCCPASGVLDYCVIAFYLRMTLTHRELLNIVRATYSFTHPLTYTYQALRFSVTLTPV